MGFTKTLLFVARTPTTRSITSGKYTTPSATSSSVSGFSVSVACTSESFHNPIRHNKSSRCRNAVLAYVTSSVSRYPVSAQTWLVISSRFMGNRLPDTAPATAPPWD